MRERGRDLSAVEIAAVVCGVVVVTVPVVAIRTVFAVPLCLLLPGYALSAAMFTRAQLERQQAAMLTVGLSLISLVLGALLLNLLPGGGLRTGTWTALLLVIVLGGAETARRRRVEPGLVTWPSGRLRGIRVSRGSVIVFALAAAIAIASFVVSRIPLPAPNALGYTELWMLPTPATPGLRIGVSSQEQHDTSYRLLVQLGTGTTVARQRFVLHSGQEHVLRLSLRGVPRATVGLATATLYRNGGASPYRQVTAQVGPPGSSGVR